jgi:hypothetical protein
MKSFHFHEVIHNKITVLEFHIIYWRLISFNQYSGIVLYIADQFLSSVCLQTLDFSFIWYVY